MATAARAEVARAAIGVIAVALAGGLLTGCAPAGTLTAQPTSSPFGVRWLLTRSALADVQVDPLVRGILRQSRLDEILRPGQSPIAGFGAALVSAFPSASALMAAVTSGRLPPGTRAVLYDPETWALTPLAEQRTVIMAAQQAAEVAHAHGLEFIVAPALDLVTVLQPFGTAPLWRQFLALHLAARLAATSDVIDLQAQSLERDAATYGSFVTAAAAQARAANPAVVVLAGLSTNPPGPPVSAGQLIAAAAASRGVVDGYWLNIPSGGPQCPECGPASPQIGIDMIRVVG